MNQLIRIVGDKMKPEIIGGFLIDIPFPDVTTLLNFKPVFCSCVIIEVVETY